LFDETPGFEGLGTRGRLDHSYYLFKYASLLPEGSLILEHHSEEFGVLDQKFAAKTIEYIWDLWAAPVELHMKNDDGASMAMCFDEVGMFTKNLNEDIELDELDFGVNK